MKLVVLGAAAGSGLPQWKCGCENCADTRAGRIAPMTQSSVAASSDGLSWVILNASPDILTQISSTNQLHPRTLRGSLIEAMILTNDDIDQMAGLLGIREQTGFDIFTTQDIRETLRLNPMLIALNPEMVN